MNTLQKQTLKAQAHHLKPVLLLGAKGLTPAVIEEAKVALLTHELIKVKIQGIEKEERTITANALCEATAAELVQLIGNTAILYKKNMEKKPATPPTRAVKPKKAIRRR